MEAAQLITGRIRDWRLASGPGRLAYGMISVGAFSLSAATDQDTVRIFISCVDSLAETSAGHEFLSDISYHCAQAL